MWWGQPFLASGRNFRAHKATNLPRETNSRIRGENVKVRVHNPFHFAHFSDLLSLLLRLEVEVPLHLLQVVLIDLSDAKKEASVCLQNKGFVTL